MSKSPIRLPRYRNSAHRLWDLERLDFALEHLRRSVTGPHQLRELCQDLRSLDLASRARHLLRLDGPLWHLPSPRQHLMLDVQSRVRALSMEMTSGCL